MKKEYKWMLGLFLYMIIVAVVGAMKDRLLAGIFVSLGTGVVFVALFYLLAFLGACLRPP